MKKSELMQILSIFIFCLIVLSIPEVTATDLERDNQQEVVSTFSNILCLDIAKYNVSSNLDPVDLYKDSIIRQNIRTVFDSANNRIETICSFINGTLEKVYVSSKEGSPYLKTSTESDASRAYNFLINYQMQTKNSIYAEFSSVLSKTDTTKNVSITDGVVKLTTNVLDKDTTFQWTYIAGDIEAPDKCVVLRFTDGFLNYFIDDWNLFHVNNRNVNLSEKEAIDIAINATKTYSPDSIKNGTIGGINFNVTNAMIAEKFLASGLYAGTDSIRNDPFELYPMYNVWVSLDKFYPGNIYGFNVYIWADTKGVYYIHQRVSTTDPPAELVASTVDSIYSYNPTISSVVELGAINSVNTILPSICIMRNDYATSLSIYLH